jgi:hypothetical protein
MIKETLMRYAKVMSALCGALVVFAMVSASSALAAKDNPLWQLGTVIAGEGTSMAIEAEASGAQKLSAARLTISCKKLVFVNAEISGSKLPESGKGKGWIRYEDCSVLGVDETKCTINDERVNKGGFETATLATLEAYGSKAAAEAEALTTGETVTVFKPLTPELFAEFTLAGTCPVLGKVKVEGTGVVMKNLGTNESLEVQEIEAPTTAKSRYFEWGTAGAVTESKASIELAGEKATFSGDARVKNTNKEKYNLAI